MARGNLLTKFSKVSLAIKLGMKIWLEFVLFDVLFWFAEDQNQTKKGFLLLDFAIVFVVVVGRRFDFIKLNRFT